MSTATITHDGQTYTRGMVCFDETAWLPALICDRHWNGWARPLLHEDTLAWWLPTGQFYAATETTSEGIRYLSGNETTEIAPRVEIGGQVYYDFGTQGLAWNDAPLYSRYAEQASVPRLRTDGAMMAGSQLLTHGGERYERTLISLDGGPRFPAWVSEHLNEDWAARPLIHADLVAQWLPNPDFPSLVIGHDTLHFNGPTGEEHTATRVSIHGENFYDLGAQGLAWEHESTAFITPSPRPAA